MFSKIKMKLKPKKSANESTPLLIFMRGNMEKEECFSELLNDAKKMLGTMVKIESLNGNLDSEASIKTEILIRRSVEISAYWKNKEFEDVLLEIDRLFAKIRFKQSASIIPICR